MRLPPGPEAELPFRLVQTAVGSAGAEERARDIVSGPLDWDTALEYVRGHALVPQLHALLRDVDDREARDVRERIGPGFRENAFGNLQYANRLHDLLDAFDERGVRVIPYKGPTLAEYAYGSLDGRTFGDLDFLVADGDVLSARDLLLDRGFEQTNLDGIVPAVLLEGSVFRWEREFRFAHRADDANVELRAEFMGANAERNDVFEDLWERREPVSVAGRDVRALSLEDRALLLLTHGTKHGWCRLSWACDVGLLFERDVDWRVVLERADRYGWLASALLGLAMVSEITGIDLPAHVRRAIASTTRARWGAALLSRWFRDDPTGARLDTDPWTLVFFANDAPADCLREFVDVAVSPQKVDYDLFPLPPRLYPLYYLVRPVQIGGRVLDGLRSRLPSTPSR